MKLSQLFTGSNQISDGGSTNAAGISQNTAAINRQIHSLVPGQTIQGEVLSRNGSEVQIKVSDDMILSAKVDQNMNLEVGKMMTFEVKNNGKALTISPLFANVATDANVLKALDMAALPVNATTVSMTEQLMKAGLSIDRNSLQQVYREINSYSKEDISNVIDLHKLGMPVNEQNVGQIGSYKNLTYQIEGGMKEILNSLSDTFQSMVQSGDMEGAVKLYREVFLMLQEGEMSMQPTSDNGINPVLTETVPAETNTQPGTAVSTETNTQTSGTVSTETNTQPGTAVSTEINTQTSGTVSTEINAQTEEAVSTEINAQTGNAFSTDTNAQISEGVSTETNAQTGEAVSTEINSQTGEMTPAEVESEMRTQTGAGAQTTETVSAEGNIKANVIAATPKELEQLLTEMLRDGNSKKINEFLANRLQALWTISPEEVADAKQVEELYHRVEKQLKGLTQALENAGQSSGKAYSAATTLSQNLDFLQQLNQTYTYVQLPLRLQQGNAHGDLYVYTNKKHLSSKEGQISALLHLDMEHLGPVDVYVAMQSEKVSTNFYVADEEMLDFLEAHMTLLTDRLQKRGYSCSVGMQVKKQGQTESGVNPLLEQNANNMPLVQYAFDMRA